MIYVGTHHKTGSVLFGRIFRDIAARLGLSIHAGWQQEAPPGTAILFMPHSRIADRAPITRGLHVVRHPFNVIRSGWRHHLHCRETWAIEPGAATLADGKVYDCGGLSYQEKLRSLDEQAGLIMEMRGRSHDALMDMYRWNYADAGFMELRYEDVMADFDGTLARAFDWLGLPVETCLEVARAHDITRLPQRRIERMPHVTDKQRRGAEVIPLTGRVLDAFRETFPADLIARLGYDEGMRGGGRGPG